MNELRMIVFTVGVVLIIVGWLLVLWTRRMSDLIVQTLEAERILARYELIDALFKTGDKNLQRAANYLMDKYDNQENENKGE